MMCSLQPPYLFANRETSLLSEEVKETEGRVIHTFCIPFFELFVLFLIIFFYFYLMAQGGFFEIFVRSRSYFSIY